MKQRDINQVLKSIILFLFFSLGLSGVTLQAAEIKLEYITGLGNPDTRGGMVMDDSYTWIADHGSPMFRVERCTGNGTPNVTTDGDGAGWDLWWYNDGGTHNGYPHDSNGTKGTDGYYIYEAGKDGTIYIVDTKTLAVTTHNGDAEAFGIYATGPTVHKLYVATDNGLDVYNITDADAPVFMEKLLSGQNLHGVRGEIGHDYIYITNYGTDKVQVIKISDHTLVEDLDIGATTSGDNSTADDIRRGWLYTDKNGNLDYYVVNDQGDLWILDATDPENLTVKGTWDSYNYTNPAGEHPGLANLPAGAVYVYEDYAYVLTSSGNDKGHIFMLDVSDPTNPDLVDHLYDEEFAFNDIRIDGCEIHIAAHDGWKLFTMSGWQPDMMISNTDDSNYIGDGIYDKNGSVQTKAQYLEVNGTAIFQYDINNTADRPEDFLFNGDAGNATWEVRYFVDSNDSEITAAVISNTYYSPTLDTNESFRMRMEVKLLQETAVCNELYEIMLSVSPTSCPENSCTGTPDATTAYVSMACEADKLGLTKTSNHAGNADGKVRTGDTITYTIDPSYVGNDLLSGLKVSDGIPVYTTYKPTSADPAVVDDNADPLVWSIGSNTADVSVSIAAVGGSEVRLDASADTYISEKADAKNAAKNETDKNYGSSTEIMVNKENNKDRRSLVMWDLSSIASTETVLSAKIEMQNNKASAGTVDIHRLTESWDESTVTWDNYNSGGTGNYDTTANGSINSTNTVGDTLDSDTMATLMQEWVDGTANHGVFLLGTAKKDIRFTSIEGTPAPVLVYELERTAAGTTASLITSRTLVPGGETFDINLTLTSDMDAATVTPGALSVVDIYGGANAINCTTPSSQAIVANTELIFTYTCEAVAGTSLPASVALRADNITTNESVVNFVPSDGVGPKSNSVLMPPALTFEVIVDSGLTGGPLDINNTAIVSENARPDANDSAVDAVVPPVIAITSDIVEESIVLAHDINISWASSEVETYVFNLDNNDTENGDYSTTYIFSDGVEYNSTTGLITVPAGVTSFTVSVSSTDDTENEDSEFYDIDVGGVAATGTILDNEQLDYTDIPDSYSITHANDGPRHNINDFSANPYLGSSGPSFETDGQPGEEADGDDAGDEEDGVLFLNAMVEDADSDLNVTANGCADGCYFSLWIDFDQNGTFDAGEQVFADEPVTDGNKTLTYHVPAGTDTDNPIYVLARLTTDAGLESTGIASDGEVEGYKLSDPSTLPITISYVHPELYGNSLEVDFATATEVGNIGFNIYAIKGKKWIKLNDEIIEGIIDDSYEPIDYHASLTVPKRLKIKKIGIAGINLDGSEDRHGPFKIGHESGSKVEIIKIDWTNVRKQVKKDKKARKAKKLAKRKARKAAKSSTSTLFKAETVDLEVTENAVYRVTHEELLSVGIDLNKQKAEYIAISLRGKGVVRYIDGLKKGKWTKNSWIEFVGSAPEGREALYLDTNQYQLSLNKKLVVDSDGIEPITRKEIVFEENKKYATSNPGDDPFHDTYFYAKGMNDSTLNRSFELNEVGDIEYEITVNLLAISHMSHHLSVSLNGEEVADMRAEGVRTLPVTFIADANILKEGSNTISMRAIGEGEPYDFYRYDKITVSYDDGKAVAALTAVITLNEKVTQKSIKPKKGTNYLMITHPLFMGGMLDHYVSQRRNEGWKIQVVNIEEVYAAYGYGMSTPDAVKAYLRVAEEKGVTHVQLVGAASYDYHDYLGLGSVSFIPSIYANTGDFSQWTPSDTLYVTDDAGMPQMAIGRWPVRTVEGLEAVINKSLAWEISGQSGKHTALFIADKDDGKNSFSGQMKSLAEQFKNKWKGDGLSHVYLDEFIHAHNDNMSVAVAAARETIEKVFNTGPSIISYSGHSSTSTWSYDGLLRQSDIASIQNQEKPTMVLPLACYTTYADSPKTTSMAHQLLAAGENGAVAVYGATHLSLYLDNEVMITKIVEHLLAGESIGEAVMNSKRELGTQYIHAIINGNLLGDVTLKVK